MLAATLLLTHTDEGGCDQCINHLLFLRRDAMCCARLIAEQAYWTLLAIVERLLPPTFFSPTLLASRASQAVLAELVKQLLPKVHDKLAELGVDLASVTFGWFLSLFTDCLPVEVSAPCPRQAGPTELALTTDTFPRMGRVLRGGAGRALPRGVVDPEAE